MQILCFCNCGSNLSEKIDAISNSINSMDIDTVVQHIRQVFQYNMSVCTYKINVYEYIVYVILLLNVYI